MEPKPERIAKVMAAAGVCSRREAERLIEQGRVRINGNTLDTPATLVEPGDVVEVDGKKIKAATGTVPRLWCYYKPTGLITSHSDPEGRPTVFEHLPKTLPRVVSVGRLDLDSEGLLLLTTSGELSRALELPRNALERTYRVRVNGTPTEKHLHMLVRGVEIEDVRYKPIDVVPDSEKTTGRNRWLTVTLREGKNREIRRLFEYFGYPVSRLIRIGYGGFELGDMEPGEIAEVSETHVVALMHDLAKTASENTPRVSRRPSREAAGVSVVKRSKGGSSHPSRKRTS